MKGLFDAYGPISDDCVENDRDPVSPAGRFDKPPAVNGAQYAAFVVHQPEKRLVPNAEGNDAVAALGQEGPILGEMATFNNGYSADSKDKSAACGGLLGIVFFEGLAERGRHKALFFEANLYDRFRTSFLAETPNFSVERVIS